MSIVPPIRHGRIILSSHTLRLLPLLVVCTQWVFALTVTAATTVHAFVCPAPPPFANPGTAFGCLMCLVSIGLLWEGQTAPTANHFIHTLVVLCGGWVVVHGTAGVTCMLDLNDVGVLTSLLIRSYLLLLPFVAVRYVLLLALQVRTAMQAFFDRPHAAVYRLRLSMGLTDTRTFVALSLAPASVCLVVVKAAVSV